MKTIILILIVTCIHYKLYAQKNDSIKLNRYYPEYFEKVKTGLDEDTECKCHPSNPDYSNQWEGIEINVPRKIYYFPSVDSIPKMPFCSYEAITSRKRSFYAFDYKILVNDLTRDTIYCGNLSKKLNDFEEEKKESLSPLYSTMRRKKNIGDENSDFLLERTIARDVAIDQLKRNHNVFNYVDMPFEDHLYEIYLEYCGFESNHFKTQIIFADRQTVFFPESFNDLKLGYEFDVDSKCHPKINRGQLKGCLISIPSEIYHYPQTDTSTIIPICSSAYYLRKEDIVEEGNIVEVFIKDLYNNKVYKGKVDFKGRDALGKKDSEYILNYPPTKKERKILADTIDEDEMCTRAFNINALDFVDMPYEAGNYEVYVKRAGYESNHMTVTIKFFYEK